jgi:hypothetical protein
LVADDVHDVGLPGEEQVADVAPLFTEKTVKLLLLAKLRRWWRTAAVSAVLILIVGDLRLQIGSNGCISEMRKSYS